MSTNVLQVFSTMTCIRYETSETLQCDRVWSCTHWLSEV